MSHKEAAGQRVAEVEPELREISRWMYEHPETAYQEHESAAKLAGWLKTNGFAVEAPAYGLETAFVGRAGDEGPEVIICVEYDALPDVGHACGHNIIATASLGAGYALLPMVEDLGFQLTVLGTPAEEQFGGKVDLIEAGAFDNATVAMMIHPTPDDVADPAALARVRLTVSYHGKEAHAAAAPQQGINALDAFVQAYVNVSTLRQHLYPTDKVHMVIYEGGSAPNIIPSYSRSSWNVRAATNERLDVLSERVMACLRAAAEATGCTMETAIEGHPYDTLESNPLLVELFSANSEALGRPLSRGADQPLGAAGSTDMGNVSHLVPSIHPFLDIKCDPAVNHQPEFAAHTVTPDGDKAIHDGALGMAWTVIDLAEQDRWDELKG